MSDDGAEQYRFACPECGERLAVNASMKDTLIERDCVICGTSVTENAFTDGSTADSS